MISYCQENTILYDGITERSSGPWDLPIVLVNRNGSRDCLDHRRLNAVPFELANAPVIFQQHIKQFLGKLQDQIALVHLDDISALQRSRNVLLSLEDAFWSSAMRIYTPEKCAFTIQRNCIHWSKGLYARQPPRPKKASGIYVRELRICLSAVKLPGVITLWWICAELNHNL